MRHPKVNQDAASCLSPEILHHAFFHELPCIPSHSGSKSGSSMATGRNNNSRAWDATRVKEERSNASGEPSFAQAGVVWRKASLPLDLPSCCAPCLGWRVLTAGTRQSPKDPQTFSPFFLPQTFSKDGRVAQIFPNIFLHLFVPICTIILDLKGFFAYKENQLDTTTTNHEQRSRSRNTCFGYKRS